MIAERGVRCGCCDEPIAATDRMDIRVILPEEALGAPDEAKHEVTPGLLRVDGVGSFARVLLPVRLSGDLELVFGAWMKIGAADLDHAAEVWDDPRYVDLVLHGTFANAIKPWAEDMFGKPVTAVVHDVEEIPYVEASDDPAFERLLTGVWDRDEVLSRFAHALPVSVQEPFGDEWSVERPAGMAARVTGKGVTQYGAPGRTILVDQVDHDRTPGEMLAEMLGNFPEWPAERILHTEDGGEIRHTRWGVSTVEERTQHEVYGYAVKPGSLLAVVCIHDDPADHAWAMHVIKSIRGR
jgi:hypothetical protein